MLARILAFSAVFVIVGAICGQEPPMHGVLLDETKPSVYIQYDTLVKESMATSDPINTRLAATEKPQFGRGSQVRLQWFNNTRSAIKIPVTKSYSPPRSRVFELDDDGKATMAMRNGESISPCYRIAERPDTEHLLRNDDWRFEFPSYKDLTLDTRFDRELGYCYHLHYGTRIAPGENVFFTVPRDYFPNHILSVSFNYEWERRASFGVGSVKHEVVFSEEDIRKVVGKPDAKEISAVASTQKPSAMEMLLNTDRPSVYVQYFEPQKILENEGHSQAEIKLWLFNNTLRAIRIPTERLDRIPRRSRPTTLPIVLEDGSDALAVRPGNRIYPCYTGANLRAEFPMGRIIRDSEVELEPAPERSSSLPFKSDCTVRSASWIASGDSVFFIVPHDRLELNDFFLLPFNYEWEKETDNIVHYITLAAYEIRN